MTTYSPVNNLRATPLPTIAMSSEQTPAVPSGWTESPMEWNYPGKGAAHPKFVQSTQISLYSQPFFYTAIPIKPLPQGSGGGGPVGTPIDSG